MTEVLTWVSTWFWALVVFSSIAWYAGLLFYVGCKGGWEIVVMARELRSRPENNAVSDNRAHSGANP